jgi:hypothetical protein
MNRKAIVILGIIALCILPIEASLVNATKSGYVFNFYLDMNGVTIDGKWTSSTEWTDAETPPLMPSTFAWREKWTMPSNIFQNVLFEFFADRTNDTGDFFQICFDPQNNGGAAPQTDDFLFNYTGNSKLTVYRGTGTGWSTTAYTGYTYGTELKIAEVLTNTQLNQTAHWVYEFMLDRGKAEWDVSGAGYTPAIRVAAYDASNDAMGVQSWPPSSANVPNDWGLETGVYGNIPEFTPFFAIGAALLLSTVAVAAGFFLKKRKN